MYTIIFKPGWCCWCPPGFQKLILSAMCVSVCPPPRLIITSGMIWAPCDWLNKFCSLCMAAIVGIVSRRGFRNEVRHRNQPNKNKLALWKQLLYFYSHLKQLYMNNKTECFSYKCGRDMCKRTRIEAIKRRASLGYR